MKTEQKWNREIRMLTQIKAAAVSSSETILHDLVGVISLVVVFFAILHLPALLLQSFWYPGACAGDRATLLRSECLWRLLLEVTHILFCKNTALRDLFTVYSENHDVFRLGAVCVAFRLFHFKLNSIWIGKWMNWKRMKKSNSCKHRKLNFCYSKMSLESWTLI